MVGDSGQKPWYHSDPRCPRWSSSPDRSPGRRYKLGDGEYVIGRRSDCQIFVPDMRVSRQHARLWRDGDGWTLEDLGSNNGTFVNGVAAAAGATSCATTTRS